MKKLLATTLSALVACTMFISCSSNNEIDAKLDAYEKAVDEYVEAIQKQVNNPGEADAQSAMEVVNASLQPLQRMTEVAKEVDKFRDDMTDEQKQRLIKISLKATQAAVPASQKNVMNDISSGFGL